jgi:hypothetical protein
MAAAQRPASASARAGQKECPPRVDLGCSCSIEQRRRACSFSGRNHSAVKRFCIFIVVVKIVFASRRGFLLLGAGLGSGVGPSVLGRAWVAYFGKNGRRLKNVLTDDHRPFAEEARGCLRPGFAIAVPEEFLLSMEPQIVGDVLVLQSSSRSSEFPVWVNSGPLARLPGTPPYLMT